MTAITLHLNFSGVSADPRDHVQIVRALRRITGLSPVWLYGSIGRWCGDRAWFALDAMPTICLTHAGRNELKAVWIILRSYGVTVLLPDEILTNIR